MTLLLAYARERLRAGRLLPAGLLVVFAVLAGRGWSWGAATAADIAAAFALVIAFRMWDDVMDRERDRSRHPQRIVVRASSTVPFTVAAVAVAIGAGILVGVTHGPASVGLLAAYSAVLAASYATRGPRSAVREWILLLKYGVFTLALVGLPAALTPRGLLSAAAAFALACVYEWLHDAESPVFSFGGSR
jgi:4-hydroxybenzoate polyprenyltransferase